MRVAGRWTPRGVIVRCGACRTRDVSVWGDAGHERRCAMAFQDLMPHVQARVIPRLRQQATIATFSRPCTWPDRPPAFPENDRTAHVQAEEVQDALRKSNPHDAQCWCHGSPRLCLDGC